MARADFNVRAGKVAWRYTALAALFFCAWLISGGVPRKSHVEKMLVLNFNRPDLQPSPRRCRCLPKARSPHLCRRRLPF